MRSFLGLCQYYAKLIEDYATLAMPLSNLTKKDASADGKVNLSESELLAFRQMQRALCNAPVLRLMDHRLPFVLQTDASAYAVGAVLMQPGSSGDLPTRPDRYR